MPDHPTVEAGSWLAGVAGTVGAALGLGSMNRMSKVRDQCNAHDVKIRALEAQAKAHGELLRETRDATVRTGEELKHVHEALNELATKIDAVC